MGAMGWALGAAPLLPPLPPAAAATAVAAKQGVTLLLCSVPELMQRVASPLLVVSVVRWAAGGAAGPTTPRGAPSAAPAVYGGCAMLVSFSPCNPRMHCRMSSIKGRTPHLILSLFVLSNPVLGSCAAWQHTGCEGGASSVAAGTLLCPAASCGDARGVVDHNWSMR